MLMKIMRMMIIKLVLIFSIFLFLYNLFRIKQLNEYLFFSFSENYNQFVKSISIYNSKTLFVSFIL